jgi:hypothetical protein
MSEVVKEPAQEPPKAGEGASAQAPTKAEPAKAEPAKVEPVVEASEKPRAEAQAPSEQKPAVPEKYDLKLPEGSSLDASYVEKVASYAKEQKLSNEQAQAVLERENTAVATYVESQKDQLKKQTETWVESLRGDKELGGEAFKENVELAKRVVHRFGSEEFRKTLSETGLGNHPELVRVFARIGKEMAEDKLVHPGSQSGGKKSLESIFYGKPE